MGLVKRYENFDGLTLSVINEFVEKVVVHECDRKGSIDTTQRVDIYLNFIGTFEPPKEEIDPAILAEHEEECRKKEECKDRLHRNYLSRKERGIEAIYYQRRKERIAAEANLLTTHCEPSDCNTVRRFFLLSKIQDPKGEISMFDISNLEHLAEDKAADAKIEKLRAERDATLAKIAKAECEIEQGENKIKRLMNFQSVKERKARTRRLIECGAIAEVFIADAENLTNVEVQELLFAGLKVPISNRAYLSTTTASRSSIVPPYRGHLVPVGAK
jgi:hypothetical protein